MNRDEVIEVSAEDALSAIAAIPTPGEGEEYPDVIHCFAGPFGADWPREAVIEEIQKATQIAWCWNVFGHELGVRCGPESGTPGRIRHFNVKRPE